MAGFVDARWLGVADREQALRLLSADPVSNLLLMDLAARLGAPPEPGESRVEVVGAWRGDELVGVAALRPSIVLDAAADKEVVEAFLPYLETLGVGLVKSAAPVVDDLWSDLGRRLDRRVIVDRIEHAYALRDPSRLVEPRPQECARHAAKGDLDALVVAARESLREEDRPDPFSGDARGFQRWVRGRIPRARVVEADHRIAMVGYADVQRPEGWLLQGIYTWPELRRRGFGRFGVSALCREAFAGGAEHVQLAVVEGNHAAQTLYESLGFEPFARLRTILFI